MMLDCGRTDLPAKKRSSYPWHVLSEAGSFFIWSERKDAMSIRSNARSKGLKVSVTTLEDRTLYVQRIS